MSDLSKLKQLSDLKYHKSEQALAKVRDRETALRSELKRLQGLAHETHCQPAVDAELRAIGGDIIWLKWLAANQRRVSIELAQVLAQKEVLLVRFRKDNGKKSVAQRLVSQEALKFEAERKRKRLDQIMDMAQTRLGDRDQ
ncbi:hypothetical protein KUV51_11510 [Tateyamaria omphalii]|uniref:hypothetical protein n=1 Tax=Tateyamaria omphalii TaxID=299262 RepID=UPI001C997E22|nr:hypothetical protein [Tateyamaria omphalii]MBY5933628.1 hypothetical protein [Tateyamaria omphalii]